MCLRTQLKDPHFDFYRFSTDPIDDHGCGSVMFSASASLRLSCSGKHQGLTMREKNGVLASLKARCVRAQIFFNLYSNL